MRKKCLLSFAAIMLLTASLVSIARAETRIERTLAPGARYVRIQRTSPEGKPLIIHYVQLDRQAKNLAFCPIKGRDHVIGTETARSDGERVTGKDGEVIAAINADFYCMEDPIAGLPCGMIVRDGELVCSPNGWPSFGFDRDGNPIASTAHLQGKIESAAGSLPIADFNRQHGKGNELVLYTSTFGPNTVNSMTSTDVILTDLKPALPFKAGVTYSGTVSEIRKGVHNDSIPANGVLLSGTGASAEFLEKNLTAGTPVSLSVQLDGEWSGVTEALGAWPRLIRDGKLQPLERDEYLTERRHARTAIGWNDKSFFVVAVDGNQPASAGVKMAELAELLQEIGCTDAMNLDGGGSTTLAVRGNVVNRPADGFDRSVSSGWAVVNKSTAGPLKSLHVTPENISVLPGSSVQFRVSGVDANGNPVQVDPNSVQWSLEGVEATSSTGDPDLKPGSFPRLKVAQGELGKVDGSGIFTATKVFRAGLITATVGDVSDCATINIWEKPAQLFVVPAKSKLKSGEKIQLSVFATDRSGRPMEIDPASVVWHCEGAKVKSGGMLTAPREGSFKVTAEVAGVHASAVGVAAK